MSFFSTKFINKNRYFLHAVMSLTMSQIWSFSTSSQRDWTECSWCAEEDEKSLPFTRDGKSRGWRFFQWKCFAGQSLKKISWKQLGYTRGQLCFLKTEVRVHFYECSLNYRGLNWIVIVGNLLPRAFSLASPAPKPGKGPGNEVAFLA